MYVRGKHASKHTVTKTFQQKTWFNAECYNARSKFKKIRNLFLKDKKRYQ